ncbi:MAG: hypothetical protein JXR48_00045 [Candidatus Delongbacteria bacterium]|nr:hypothetical protein [Candidatus Delongbacteria bacterium]
MKNIILLLMVLLILSNCTKKETDFEVFSKFSQELTVDGTKIDLKPGISFPVELEMLDSVFVLINLDGDYFFDLYSNINFTFINNVLPKGKGPNEEIFVEPYVKYIKDNIFLYSNSYSVNIVEYLMKEKSLLSLKKYKLTGELFDLQDAFIIGDNIIGHFIDKSTSREFVEYNVNTHKVTDFGSEFPYYKEIPNSKNNTIFQKISAVKPDKEKIATVYGFFPILKIHSSDGELIKEVRYLNNQSFPDALVDDNPSEEKRRSLERCYAKIEVTDNYIYALYSGRKSGDVQSGLNDISNVIHVWDWNGNPIKKIILNRDLFSFCVAKDDSYLICSSLNEPDFIYKYEL